MKILIKLHLLLIKDIFAVDLDQINFEEDNNFDKGHTDTMIPVRLLAWQNKFEKRKALKKKEELMHIPWHPKRWWDLCLSEDEKK